MKPKHVVAAKLLPINPRVLLQQCALVDPQHKIGDSYERTKALDTAIKSIRQHNPQFFRKE